MPPHSSSRSAAPDSTASGITAKTRGKSKPKPNGHAPSVPKAKPRGSPGRLRAIIGSLVLAGLWAIVHFSGWALRPSHALCSRDGDFIYTVDQDNSNVQCVVVTGAYISYTGSLCALSVLLEASACSYSALAMSNSYSRSHPSSQALPHLRYNRTVSPSIPARNSLHSLRFHPRPRN
jgi:hypothetical protein